MNESDVQAALKAVVKILQKRGYTFHHHKAVYTTQNDVVVLKFTKSEKVADIIVMACVSGLRDVANGYLAEEGGQ